MNNPILYLLALSIGLCAPVTTGAQSYFEIGAMGGDMPYNGDLAETGAGFLRNWNTFGGFYLRYRPINRVGLRLNGVFGRIDSEVQTDVKVSASNDRVPITRNFRSPIQEFSLAVEVDLFYIGDANDRFLAPYVMAGLGITSFNPEGELGGEYYDLQPLRTEGQGILGGSFNYDPAAYELSITTFHAGGGIRAKLGERIVIGGEVSGRLTGTDYLDDVTGQRINYAELLVNSGDLAAQFSNPGIDPNGDIPTDLDYKRGGDGDDVYFLINLTVGVRLGSGGLGGGGKGCYSF